MRFPFTASLVGLFNGGFVMERGIQHLSCGQILELFLLCVCVYVCDVFYTRREVGQASVVSCANASTCRFAHINMSMHGCICMQLCAFACPEGVVRAAAWLCVYLWIVSQGTEGVKCVYVSGCLHSCWCVSSQSIKSSAYLTSASVLRKQICSWAYCTAVTRALGCICVLHYYRWRC